MTLFIQDGVENLDLVAAYAGAVILALVALGVLALVGADRRETTTERRKPRWRSRSGPSPSDSELPLLSTT
jgi:ABC-type sulfate transport system permease subunit